MSGANVQRIEVLHISDTYRMFSPISQHHCTFHSIDIAVKSDYTSPSDLDAQPHRAFP